MNQQSIDVDPNITRTAVPISYSNRAVPSITFLMLSVITLGLWQSQISHRRELLLKHAETSIEQLKVRIEGIMKGNVAAAEGQLGEIARRCGTSCEAYAQLSNTIATYKATAGIKS